MSWEDRFQDGSFRGVPFFIQEAPTQGGRRQQMHQYPGRDTPWTEDLGRQGKNWQIEAIVIGADYDQARDALVAALDAPGPGTLIHPYLGTLQASVGQYTVTDSTAAGGMATFSIPFMEAGADTQPAPTPDTGVAANAAAGQVQAASLDNIGNNLAIPSSEAFVGQSATSLLGQASTAIGAALAAVSPDPLAAFPIQGIVATLASGAGLLANPPALVGAVYGAIAGVGDLATYSDDALTQLTGLIVFGADLPPIAPITPSRAAQGANQTALVLLVRCAAAAAAVNVVAQSDFSSYDEAAGIRDPLSDQLDDLATTIADSGDDNLAAAMDTLRLAMVADVTARGASLARLYAYTPQTTEPAVVIAQRLYGDASWADDIISRNGFVRPAFVPGGVPIEVLNAG